MVYSINEFVVVPVVTNIPMEAYEHSLGVIRFDTWIRYLEHCASTRTKKLVNVNAELTRTSTATVIRNKLVVNNLCSQL